MIGPGSRELCDGHEDLAATDVNSPLDRLARTGGYVLLLGVGHIANTTVHVGEFRANAPYLDVPPRPAWPRVHEIETGGGTRVVGYDRFPGCSRAFGVVERGLRDRSVIRDGRVGLAESQLMPGEALIEETVTLLGATHTHCCAQMRQSTTAARACARSSAARRALEAEQRKRVSVDELLDRVEGNGGQRSPGDRVVDTS